MLNRNPQNNLIDGTVFNPPAASAANFESVTMPHLNDLYRTALYLLPQPAQASSAVEETYLRAREAFGERSRGTNCKTWLFQILIHVVRLTRMQAKGVISAKGDNRSSSSVLSALDRISQDSREVVLLVDGHGFSYMDAAAILGLSTVAVAQHIVNGRSHLQSELEGSRSTFVYERNCI